MRGRDRLPVHASVIAVKLLMNPMATRTPPRMTLLALLPPTVVTVSTARRPSSPIASFSVRSRLITLLARGAWRRTLGVEIDLATLPPWHPCTLALRYVLPIHTPPANADLLDRSKTLSQDPTSMNPSFEDST